MSNTYAGSTYEEGPYDSEYPDLNQPYKHRSEFSAEELKKFYKVVTRA